MPKLLKNWEVVNLLPGDHRFDPAASALKGIIDYQEGETATVITSRLLGRRGEVIEAINGKTYELGDCAMLSDARHDVMRLLRNLE